MAAVAKSIENRKPKYRVLGVSNAQYGKWWRRAAAGCSYKLAPWWLPRRSSWEVVDMTESFSCSACLALRIVENERFTGLDFSLSCLVVSPPGPVPRQLPSFNAVRVRKLTLGLPALSSTSPALLLLAIFQNL